MWKLVLAVVALAFTIAPASAKNRVNKVKPPVFQETKTAELNELSDEYLECSAYFLVTAYCIGGYPAPAVPKIIRDYQQAAKKALGLAASTGRVTEALVEARSKSVAAAQMQSINSNCMNIRDLSERHDAFCKQLMEAPDTRIKELISGRMCTGLYKCSLSSKSGTTAVTYGRLN